MAREEVAHALQLCLDTLEATRNQYWQLKEKFFNMYPDLHPAQYASQSHHFLTVPDIDEEVDLSVGIRHLQKYAAIVQQMQEQGVAEEYTEAIKDSNIQLQQLLEFLRLTLQLMNQGDDTVDTSEVDLPEELMASSSRSAQRSRDFLFIRDYEKLLNLLESILIRHRTSMD